MEITTHSKCPPFTLELATFTKYFTQALMSLFNTVMILHLIRNSICKVRRCSRALREFTVVKEGRSHSEFGPELLNSGQVRG